MARFFAGGGKWRTFGCTRVPGTDATRKLSRSGVVKQEKTRRSGSFPEFSPWWGVKWRCVDGERPRRIWVAERGPR